MAAPYLDEKAPEEDSEDEASVQRVEARQPDPEDESLLGYRSQFIAPFLEENRWTLVEGTGGLG